MTIAQQAAQRLTVQQLPQYGEGDRGPAPAAINGTGGAFVMPKAKASQVAL